jgi:hypothetical protein
MQQRDETGGGRSLEPQCCGCWLCCFRDFPTVDSGTGKETPSTRVTSFRWGGTFDTSSHDAKGALRRPALTVAVHGRNKKKENTTNSAVGWHPTAATEWNQGVEPLSLKLPNPES